MILRLLLLGILFTCVGCQNEEAAASPLITMCGGGATLVEPSDLPSPKRWSGIGNSHLSITTKDTTVQSWFNQGVDMLHGFYHLEAYRAFLEVLKIDPNCAMAYWGIAMCQPGFGGSERWQSAVAKAAKLAEQQSISPLEQDLINALQLTLSAGLTAASDRWIAIVNTYADQSPDALALAGIMLRQVVATQVQSDKLKTLFELALQQYPDHVGLGHYYTHVMEVREDFIKAKAVAERTAAMAPNAPHLAHMPGHIYFLEGDYAKTVSTFENARRQEEAYHRNNNIPYTANQNYFHNLHYLAVAYSELGKKNKALEAAQCYAHLSLRQGVPLDGNALMILYEGRILPAMVYLRFREYAAAAKYLAFWLHHPELAADHPMVRLYLESLQTYCNGMAAIEQGEHAFAQSYFEELNQHIQDFEARSQAWPKNAEFDAINQVYDVMSLARLQLQGWLDNLNSEQAFDTSAWDEAFALEAILPYDEPPRLMYPVGESLLHLQLLREDKRAATAAAELALKRRPYSPIINRALSQEINKL